MIGEQRWWSKNGPDPNAEWIDGEQPKSIDVEMTSYGVLALIEADQFNAALPFFKWLLAQRNDKGGFIGTQDTVIGLEALTSFGQSVSCNDNDIQLKIKSDMMDEQIMDVTSTDALKQQSVELPSDTKSVDVSAIGHGCALIQLSYQYNSNENDINSAFTLAPTVIEISPGYLIIHVCARFDTKNQKS